MLIMSKYHVIRHKTKNGINKFTGSWFDIRESGGGGFRVLEVTVSVARGADAVNQSRHLQ